jgi:hypothetical protein
MSTVKINVSYLVGPALDWAVAKCLGMFVRMTRGGWLDFDSDAYPEFSNTYNDDKMQSFRPSIYWHQAGPVIEREVPMLLKTNGGDWIAQGPYDHINDREAPRYYGPTPLIAAMRCYVASKLGDIVEVPRELYKEEN